jgi:hypothetical protein
LIKPDLGMVESNEFIQPTQTQLPDYRDGKPVFQFTYPIDAKGGIFSKTYLQIDDGFVLRIRSQMFTAEELWPSKDNEDNKE